MTPTPLDILRARTEAQPAPAPARDLTGPARTLDVDETDPTMHDAITGTTGTPEPRDRECTITVRVAGREPVTIHTTAGRALAAFEGDPAPFLADVESARILMGGAA